MGLGMPTHGPGMRAEERGRLQVVPSVESRSAQRAQRAERCGDDSVSGSAHSLVTRKSGSDSHALCLAGAEPVPNQGLQATPNSLVSLMGDVGESPSRRTWT
jgi:hypothetical protein